MLISTKERRKHYVLSEESHPVCSNQNGGDKMNERIRELRRQATLVETYTANDGSVHEGKSVDLEKFAELIVRDCVNELLKWKSEPFPLDAESAARIIQEHFGVE